MDNDRTEAPVAPRLAARIVLAMKTVGSVAKAGRNKDQGYAYQKAADIFEAVQGAFVEHGIFLGATERIIEWPDPLTTKSGATMFICRATMAYGLEDVLSGEMKEFVSTGVGFDTSDKALNKAKTMAEKYFLKQLLLIGEEEDDADLDTPEETQQPACPVCGVVGAIIKGKPEYGGGWLCFQKKGGCGAKFQNDPTLKPPAIASDSPKEEKAQRRPRSTPKSETAPEPAPALESGPDSALGAGAGIPEAEGNGQFDQEIANLWELCEATKFPGGMAKFLSIFRVGQLGDLNKAQREQLRGTLEKRAKLIAEGKIEI